MKYERKETRNEVDVLYDRRREELEKERSQLEHAAHVVANRRVARPTNMRDRAARVANSRCQEELAKISAEENKKIQEVRDEARKQQRLTLQIYEDAKRAAHAACAAATAEAQRDLTGALAQIEADFQKKLAELGEWREAEQKKGKRAA